MNSIVSTFEAGGKTFNVVEVDGETPIPVSEIEYKDGWSVQTKHGICVRNEKVDQFLDGLLATGDAAGKKVAARTPRWFAVLLDDIEYTEAQLKVFSHNYNRGPGSWGASAMAGVMHVFSYHPDATGRQDLGEPASDCAQPIYGFDIYYVDEVFAKKYRRMLMRDIAKLRKNPNAPSFDNWHK